MMRVLPSATALPASRQPSASPISMRPSRAPRPQCPAVEHDGRIRGEDEIGQARHGREELDRRAKLGELAVKRAPFAFRRGVRANVAGPALRVHPRIDGIADREVLRPAHEETRAAIIEWRYLHLPLLKLTSCPCANFTPPARVRACRPVRAEPPRSDRAPSRDPRAR